MVATRAMVLVGPLRAVAENSSDRKARNATVPGQRDTLQQRAASIAAAQKRHGRVLKGCIARLEQAAGAGLKMKGVANGATIS